METIKVRAELLFELSSKQDWINKVPRILPRKAPAEQWVWLDMNGNVFTIGQDFSAAELIGSYPCRVYKLRRVSETVI